MKSKQLKDLSQEFHSETVEQLYFNRLNQLREEDLDEDLRVGEAQLIKNFAIDTSLFDFKGRLAALAQSGASKEELAICQRYSEQIQQQMNFEIVTAPDTINSKKERIYFMVNNDTALKENTLLDWLFRIVPEAGKKEYAMALVDIFIEIAGNIEMIDDFNGNPVQFLKYGDMEYIRHYRDSAIHALLALFKEEYATGTLFADVSVDCIKNVQKEYAKNRHGMQYNLMAGPDLLDAVFNFKETVLFSKNSLRYVTSLRKYMQVFVEKVHLYHIIFPHDSEDGKLPIPSLPALRLSQIVASSMMTLKDYRPDVEMVENMGKEESYDTSTVEYQKQKFLSDMPIRSLGKLTDQIRMIFSEMLPHTEQIKSIITMLEKLSLSISPLILFEHRLAKLIRSGVISNDISKKVLEKISHKEEFFSEKDRLQRQSIIAESTPLFVHTDINAFKKLGDYGNVQQFKAYSQPFVKAGGFGQHIIKMFRYAEVTGRFGMVHFAQEKPDDKGLISCHATCRVPNAVIQVVTGQHPNYHFAKSPHILCLGLSHFTKAPEDILYPYAFIMVGTDQSIVPGTQHILARMIKNDQGRQKYYETDAIMPGPGSDVYNKLVFYTLRELFQKCRYYDNVMDETQKTEAKQLINLDSQRLYVAMSLGGRKKKPAS